MCKEYWIISKLSLFCEVCVSPLDIPSLLFIQNSSYMSYSYFSKLILLAHMSVCHKFLEICQVFSFEVFTYYFVVVHVQLHMYVHGAINVFMCVWIWKLEATIGCHSLDAIHWMPFTLAFENVSSFAESLPINYPACHGSPGSPSISPTIHSAKMIKRYHHAQFFTFYLGSRVWPQGFRKTLPT